MTSPATAQRGNDAATNFIAHLIRYHEREDRGALAALRRSLGQPPGTISETCRIVEPFLSERSSQERIDAFYLVGGLFALHPEHSDRGRNFGEDIRAVRFREDSRDEDPGVSRRFMALLDCDVDGLPTHLRHLITLLRSRSATAPINYVQLLKDILSWEHPDRYVQRKWASGFWGGREIATGNTPAGELAGDSEDSSGGDS